MADDSWVKVIGVDVGSTMEQSEFQSSNMRYRYDVGC